MSRGRWSAVIALVALGAVTGCGNDTVAPLAPCTGEVAISVTRGTSPTFTWAPRCGVTSLAIDPTPPSNSVSYVRWQIMAGTNLIGPGVRYGVVPRGATELAPAIPLQPGAESRVFVFGGSNNAPIGAALFTP